MTAAAQTNHTTSLERITSWHQMEGKTIRRIIDGPCGDKSSGVEAVLVFDDQSWAAVCCSDEDVIIEISSWRAKQITDVLSPAELLAADLINMAQYDLLVEQANQRKREQLEQQAERLRRQIRSLGPLESDAARHKTILEAATMIEEAAKGLANGHSLDGQWPEEEAETKAIHDGHLATAAALRALVPADQQPIEKAAA